MSMWSHSAPCVMVSEQAAPNAAKSADKIEGAMTAGGDIAASSKSDRIVERRYWMRRTPKLRLTVTVPCQSMND